MECPLGMPCTLTCAGQKSCQNASLNCSSDYGCIVICSGVQSCGGLVVDCTQGAACTLACGSSNKACESSTVLVCGSKDCHASCASEERPTLAGCENSCRKTGCGCS